MQYARDVTRATSVVLLWLVCACGKSEKSAAVVVADEPRAHDAAVIVEADASPFVVEKRRSFGETTVIHPRGATCPAIELRKDAEERGLVSIERCKDQPFVDQIPQLRDMASQLRSMDPQGFERVRISSSADFYGWPELGRRYIAYAKDHPFKPKTSIHDYVLAAGASAEMWPEYAAIFQRKPKLTSVEKCTTGRATRKDMAGDFLRAEGVKGNAEIPLGCSIGVLELSR
jgi:hypothetical protein